MNLTKTNKIIEFFTYKETSSTSTKKLKENTSKTKIKTETNQENQNLNEIYKYDIIEEISKKQEKIGFLQSNFHNFVNGSKFSNKEKNLKHNFKVEECLLRKTAVKILSFEEKDKKKPLKLREKSWIVGKENEMRRVNKENMKKSNFYLTNWSKYRKNLMENRINHSEDIDDKDKEDNKDKEESINDNNNIHTYSLSNPINNPIMINEDKNERKYLLPYKKKSISKLVPDYKKNESTSNLNQINNKEYNSMNITHTKANISFNNEKTNLKSRSSLFIPHINLYKNKKNDDFTNEIITKCDSYCRLSNQLNSKLSNNLKEKQRKSITSYNNEEMISNQTDFPLNKQTNTNSFQGNSTLSSINKTSFFPNNLKYSSTIIYYKGNKLQKRYLSNDDSNKLAKSEVVNSISSSNAFKFRKYFEEKFEVGIDRNDLFGLTNERMKINVKDKVLINKKLLEIKENPLFDKVDYVLNKIISDKKKRIVI